jgi:hypothetical protein
MCGSNGADLFSGGCGGGDNVIIDPHNENELDGIRAA